MPEGLVIRRASSVDVADISRLTREAYAPWVARVGREPLPMTADYEAAVRDHLVDLAFWDGALCALVELVAEPDCLLIENLAVAPDHQGKGLGGTLLRHAESQARELGFGSVRLYTNRAFGSNVEFYQHHGYAIEREEPFMGGLTVYMRKPLGE